MFETGIILVAAGESKRLGRPKQLLPFRGRTLLWHAAGVAVESGIGPVAVVLGAVADECRAALEGLEVPLVFNESWCEGMGTSIAKGMAMLLPMQLESVIIMLCDQPAVSPQTLRKLLSEQRVSGAEIVASFYAGIAGPPALFTSPCFPRLLALQGEGARSLISAGQFVSRVPFPEGDLDVDELAQMQRFRDYEAIAWPELNTPDSLGKA